VRTWKEGRLFNSLIWLLINKREKWICKWLIRFANRSSPSPFCELNKWKQESCICSRLDVSTCAQGQNYFFGGGKKKNKSAASELQYPFLSPSGTSGTSTTVALLLAEALQTPEPASVWETKDPPRALQEAGDLPLPTSSTPAANAPLSFTQAELFLLGKHVQSIPLMPLVGGLALGDQNNCWLRSASQENNNVSSLSSAVTLTSGLRLLHCTRDVTSLAADLNQQRVDHPGGKGVERVQKVLLNPKEQKEESLEPSNKRRKVLVWQEARWYFFKQLFPLLCTSAAKTCLISAAAWGRSSNPTPLTWKKVLILQLLIESKRREKEGGRVLLN